MQIVSDWLAYINRHDGNWIKVLELFAGTLHTCVLAVEHLTIVPRYNASLFGCNAQRKFFCLIKEGILVSMECRVSDG